MDEQFDLTKFNDYREDNRLEVKRAKDKLPDTLWETYSSFANTEGGCIILGVKEKDDKSWYTTGLKNIEKLKKEFFDIIHNQNKVSIALVSDNNVSSYTVDDDVILVIKIPKAQRDQKPVYINNDIWNGTYYRDGEGDYHCSHETILAMLRDQTENTPDMKILEENEIKDFDQNSIRSYRMQYNNLHVEHPWSELSDNEFLVRIGAASDDTTDHKIHPTAAGLLMFGMYHKIVREFPSFLLDYYEKNNPSLRWADRIASHNGDWSGNIYDFFSKVYQRIAGDLKKPFKLDGIYRIEDTPVHVAVREALVNCLSNADYLLPECVKIEKYLDKLVLTNPGTILIGKKQMLRGGKSRPRNKSILNMFNYIGIGERAGSGVPNIYETWNQEGFMEPTVEESSGRGGIITTVITLPFTMRTSTLLEKGPVKGPIKGPVKGPIKGPVKGPIKGPEKGPIKGPEKGPVKGPVKTTRRRLKKHSESKTEEVIARCETILNEMKENPKISRSTLMKKLNLTDKQVRIAIDHIKNSGKAHYEGVGRNGYWVVDE